MLLKHVFAITMDVLYSTISFTASIMYWQFQPQQVVSLGSLCFLTEWLTLEYTAAELSYQGCYQVVLVFEIMQCLMCGAVSKQCILYVVIQQEMKKKKKKLWGLQSYAGVHPAFRLIGVVNSTLNDFHRDRDWAELGSSWGEWFTQLIYSQWLHRDHSGYTGHDILQRPFHSTRTLSAHTSVMNTEGKPGQL